jgi:hypothetical protein
MISTQQQDSVECSSLQACCHATVVAVLQTAQHAKQTVYSIGCTAQHTRSCDSSSCGSLAARTFIIPASFTASSHPAQSTQCKDVQYLSQRTCAAHVTNSTAIRQTMQHNNTRKRSLAHKDGINRYANR